MSFASCLKAADLTTREKLAISEAVKNRKAGVPKEAAAAAYVEGVLDDLKAERGDYVKAIEKQYKIDHPVKEVVVKEVKKEAPEPKAKEPEVEVAKQVVEPTELKVEPTKKPLESKVYTLRGRIKAEGGINFGNLKGELREMPQGVKIGLARKTGISLDVIERTLIDEGWLDKNESLLEVLRDPENMKRGKLGDELKTVSQKAKQKEQQWEYEPEEPPPGEYDIVKAEDLKEGETYTIIDGSGIDGWDVYKVIAKDPFEVTLEDGTTVELSPLDEVQVLKETKKSQISPKSDIIKTLTNETGSSQLATDIYNFANKIVQDGVKSFKVFSARMYNKFREIWKKIKSHLKSLWDVLENQRGMVEVWHGSPYKFPKFKTGKIGTGEGAQSFGWGLYFTDKEEIARHYANQLGDQYITDFSIKRVPIYRKGKPTDYSPRTSDDSSIARANLIEHMLIYENDIKRAFDKSPKDGLKKIQENFDDLIEIYSEDNDAYSENMVRYFKLFKPKKLSDIKWKVESDRYLYKATINKGREDVWLDWDKPVTDNIEKQLYKYFVENEKNLKEIYTGSTIREIQGALSNVHSEDLYNGLRNAFGSAKEASLFLKRAGIDGIRYPTESLSGVKGSDKFNYVVFDENAIVINKVRNLLSNEIGSSNLINDIAFYGAGLVRKGVKSFKEFSNAMQKRFKHVWDKLSKLIKSMWDILKSEGGYVVLRQGHSYQETLEPVVEQDYIENRKAKTNIKLAAEVATARIGSEIKEGIDKFTGSISTRLGNISKKLKAKIRRLDIDINRKSQADVLAVKPMLDKAKKNMTKVDFADWDYARKNSDTEKINELVDKYEMRKSYDDYRVVLTGLRSEGLDVGLDIGLIEEYAPRILKDSRGFLTAIGKDPDWGNYSEAIKKRAKELEMSMDDMDIEQKAQIISNMILGGSSGLGGVPATKERKLKKIPVYLNRYYMDSDGALMRHIYSMRKLIEARKFFGKIPKKVAEMRRRLHVAQTHMRKLSKEMKTATGPNKAKMKKRWNKLSGLAKQYQAYLDKYAMQRDYRENIGAYIGELIESGEIRKHQEGVVNEILNARFHEKGPHGIVQAYKNFSYIDTMGSPISALTQIGDMAWAAFDGGLITALKHASRSILKKSRITKEDVWISRIAQEFEDASTLGNAVTKIFKWVGLEKIDSIGKEALLNTAYEKYKKRAAKDPEKLKDEIRYIFEDETDSVIEDLINDEITDNVKVLVYSRVLDFQPVGLSEMPEKYLTAGNGRIFYMLKTFTLKQFDIYRNEIYNKFKNGDQAEKIQAIKNLVRLTMFFVVANAGADELKDWVLGRKTDFEDRVVDNVLRLAGVSKFYTWKARTEGIGTATLRLILPPVKFFDALSKDIATAGDEKGLETVSSIPLLGKLAYWHMGRGVSKRDDLWDIRLRKEKARLNKIKDIVESSEDQAMARRKYSKDIVRLNRANALQGRLNKFKQRINRLKKSGARQADIDRLTNKRIDFIKQFLK